jgi:hypothetical protein
MLLASILLGAGEASLHFGARFLALAAGILLGTLAVVRAWSNPLQADRGAHEGEPSRTTALARTPSSKQATVRVPVRRDGGRRP